MTQDEKPFVIRAYSLKELVGLYDVSLKTFKRWINPIQDLGSYTGKKFTPAQVRRIVEHLGEPIITM